MDKQRFKTILADVAQHYITHRIPIAAAGLTYFLTLSFFPLLICLQSMLGSLFTTPEEIRGILLLLLPEAIVTPVLEYLRYVSENQSGAMLVMALAVVATSSAAAFRTINRIIGDMRGRRRYTGTGALVFSFIFSLFFLAAIYLAVILIVTGKWFLNYVDRHIYFMNISGSWAWARFVLLFLLLFPIIGGVYRITAPREGRVLSLPGAALASGALVAVSIVFSAFIGASATYPLIYGSLASVIVIMLWLYACGIILFLGGAVNVALERNPKK